MDQQLRELFDKDDLQGEFDAIVERLGRQRSADDPNYRIGETHANQILAAIVERYAGRPDDIPEVLHDSLLEGGHLGVPDDSSSQSFLNLLTKKEKEVVLALNGHMSIVQENAFIRALQNGNSLVTVRVLAVLSWLGLMNLNALITKAAFGMFEEMRKQANPEVESREVAYEALCEVAPFFPDDEDEWEMEEEEERTKRLDTERALWDLVTFLRPANPAPAVKQTSKGMKR